MSAPSRGPEIRRQQTRKRKTAKLREKYAAANADAERERIIEKARKMNPAFRMDEFAAAALRKK